MPTTTQDLALQVRRGLGDWGAYLMKLASEATAGATTITVTPTGTDYLRAGLFLNIDIEDLEIVEPVGSPIVVMRARRGTTDATHAALTQVFLSPRFTNQDIVTALNESLRVFGGLVPKVTVDSTITTVASTEEYTLPTGCKHVYLVEMERSTSDTFRPWRTWDVNYASGKLRLLGRLSAGRTIRLTYHADWTALTWATSDVVVPDRFHGVLVDYAVGDLLLREATMKVAVVGQAKGDTATLRESLIAAQTLKATAKDKLEAIRDVTSIIQLRDKRSQRL